MKEMQRLLEEIEVTEKILGLLKDVRSHIDISVCMTHIEVTENITNFIRTEYELKLKKLERQWEEKTMGGEDNDKNNSSNVNPK